MKVSFLTTWNTRCGIADYSKRLMLELSRYCEITTTILNPCFNPLYYRQLGKKMNHADIAHIQFEYELFNLINPYINNLLALLEQIKIPKIITLHSSLPLFSPCPFSSSLLWNIGTTLRNGLYFPFKDKWQKKLINNQTLFFVHADKIRRSLLQSKKECENVFYVPHPLYEPIMIDDATKMRTEYGLEGKTVLTIFGFIHPLKGYEVMFDALTFLPQHVVLIIAGEARTPKNTPYTTFLKKYIYKKRLNNRIRFTGYLTEREVAEVMAVTDIYVAPFISMNASGSLSTALSYEKTIIASDLEPNKEINERFDCLELFAAGDSSDLLRKMSALLESPKRRECLSKNTQKYKHLYNFSTFAQETFKAYSAVIKKTQ